MLLVASIIPFSALSEWLSGGCALSSRKVSEAAHQDPDVLSPRGLVKCSLRKIVHPYCKTTPLQIEAVLHNEHHFSRMMEGNECPRVEITSWMVLNTKTSKAVNLHLG